MLHLRRSSLLLAVLLVSLLAITAMPQAASAHEEESEGSITAVLHITPHDQPVLNKQSKIEIAFADSHKAFRLSDCDCTLSINTGGKQVAALPLHAVKPRVSSNQYVFQQPGAYQLVVQGRPIAGDAFDPFTVTYPVTVAEHKDAIPLIVWLGVGAAIVLALGVAVSMSTVPKRFKL